jgi:histidinol-phosphatase
VISVTEDLAFAHVLADTADRITRPFVGAAIAGATIKADGSLVTPVDLAVERALLALVLQERPSYGLLGEEVGQARTGDRRWIIDGVDGTAAFVARRPEWSTLIALEADGTLALGVVSAPALSARWWAASGTGAWSGSSPDGGHVEPDRLAVSAEGSLAHARLGMWPPALTMHGPRRDAALRTAAVCRNSRLLPDARGRDPEQRPSWGSGYPNAGLLVAAGALDGVVLFKGGPWDHAALAVIVEEAGGRFSDLRGQRRIDTGGAVFSNGQMHSALLAAIAL